MCLTYGLGNASSEEEHEAATRENTTIISNDRYFFTYAIYVLRKLESKEISSLMDLTSFVY